MKIINVLEEGKGSSYGTNHKWVYKQEEGNQYLRICELTGRLELVEMSQEQKDFHSVFEKFYQKKMKKVKIEDIPSAYTYMTIIRGVLYNREDLNTTYHPEDIICQNKVKLDSKQVLHGRTNYFVLGKIIKQSTQGILTSEDLDLINEKENDFEYNREIYEQLLKFGLSEEDIEELELRTHIVGYHSS